MINLSRRVFAFSLPAAGVAAAAALTPGVQVAAAQTPASGPVSPLAQIRIGRFTVTALSDGFADMPYGYFPGQAAEQVEAAARAQFVARSTGVRFVFNQYLVEDGERRILIDAGPAGSMGQTGHLPKALAALSLRADQVDAVIVTHMHQDHMGGLVAGDRRVFPKAEVYVDRRDVRYWTDTARQARAPDFLQGSFRMAADLVRLYPGLQATEGDYQIMRGLSLVDLAGHTPGHIGVRIEDGGQSLIMVSDMLFPVVHPEATNVAFLFEQDRPAAEAMRARFFPQAAEEKVLIAATHMPFPGLGRIVREDRKLRWLAADWAFQS